MRTRASQDLLSKSRLQGESAALPSQQWLPNCMHAHLKASTPSEHKQPTQPPPPTPHRGNPLLALWRDLSSLQHMLHVVRACAGFLSVAWSLGRTPAAAVWGACKTDNAVVNSIPWRAGAGQRGPGCTSRPWDAPDPSLQPHLHAHLCPRLRCVLLQLGSACKLSSGQDPGDRALPTSFWT